MFSMHTRQTSHFIHSNAHPCRGPTVICSSSVDRFLPFPTLMLVFTVIMQRVPAMDLLLISLLSHLQFKWETNSGSAVAPQRPGHSYKGNGAAGEGDEGAGEFVGDSDAESVTVAVWDGGWAVGGAESDTDGEAVLVAVPVSGGVADSLTAPLLATLGEIVGE
jgi:hypothetical protein